MLLHHTQLSMQREAPNVADFVAVDEHFAVGRQIELRDQVNDRALAATGVPHQSDRLPRFDHQIHIMQNLLTRHVAKR